MKRTVGTAKPRSSPAGQRAWFAKVRRSGSITCSLTPTSGVAGRRLSARAEGRHSASPTHPRLRLAQRESMLSACSFSHQHLDGWSTEQNEGRARGPALRGAAVLDQVRTAATAVERLAPDAACRTAGGPTRGAGEGCGAVVVAGGSVNDSPGPRGPKPLSVGGSVVADGPHPEA